MSNRTAKRLKLLACASGVLLACTNPAMAGAQETPRSGATTLIHAGRLLDRPGQQPRGRTTIVIRDGRIVELRDGFARAAQGETVIDLSDRFVLPGLMDAHVHLASNDDGASTTPSNYPIFESVTHARDTLMAGFTTVRNLGDQVPIALQVRDAINAGKIVGPRVLVAGAVRCQEVIECRNAVLFEIGRGADLIKIFTTGLANIEAIGPDRGATMTLDQASMVVQTAHQYGLKVSSHAHGGQGFNVALDAGVDSIEHGKLMSDADVARIVSEGTYYDPTLSTVRAFEAGASHEDAESNPLVGAAHLAAVSGDAPERAIRAGARMALGTDAGISKHGQNATELELLVEKGLTPMQAIVAGTVNNADLFDISDEAGTIEAGKLADIIAVDGDPLSNISVMRDVSFVMREGIVYKQ